MRGVGGFSAGSRIGGASAGLGWDEAPTDIESASGAGPGAGTEPVTDVHSRPASPVVDIRPHGDNVSQPVPQPAHVCEDAGPDADAVAVAEVAPEPPMGTPQVSRHEARTRSNPSPSPSPGPDVMHSPGAITPTARRDTPGGPRRHAYHDSPAASPARSVASAASVATAEAAAGA